MFKQIGSKIGKAFGFSYPPDIPKTLRIRTAKFLASYPGSKDRLHESFFRLRISTKIQHSKLRVISVNTSLFSHEKLTIYPNHVRSDRTALFT